MGLHAGANVQRLPRSVQLFLREIDDLGYGLTSIRAALRGPLTCRFRGQLVAPHLNGTANPFRR
jgi:hypothetical protein